MAFDHYQQAVLARCVMALFVVQGQDNRIFDQSLIIGGRNDQYCRQRGGLEVLFRKNTIKQLHQFGVKDAVTNKNSEKGRTCRR